MSSAAIKKDPKIVAKVMELVESGLGPEQIAARLLEDKEAELLEEEEGPVNEREKFPDAIKMIAQALCFRVGTINDIDDIAKVLNAAYNFEINNTFDKKEAFRSAEDAVSIHDIADLFDSSSYRWLLVEAPNGHGIEVDGVLLGVVCYSVDGVSKKNGEIEGKLGSVRLLGILPRYLGLCIGQRLLKRCESEMLKSDCCRVMVCIPSPRISMLEWIQRRGYTNAGVTKYPAGALDHKLTIPDVQLIIFLKGIMIDENVSSISDVKSNIKKISIVNSTPSPTSNPSMSRVINRDEGIPPPNVLPQVPGKMHLPPQWRYTGDPTLPIPPVNNESVSSSPMIADSKSSIIDEAFDVD